jgi:hypothetical protein
MIRPRTVALFIVLLVGIGIITYGELYTEYVSNKGPDDLGADEYAQAFLKYKYGSLEGSSSVQIQSFSASGTGNKIGVYTISVNYNGSRDLIKFKYDGKDFIFLSDEPK